MSFFKQTLRFSLIIVFGLTACNALKNGSEEGLLNIPTSERIDKATMVSTPLTELVTTLTVEGGTNEIKGNITDDAISPIKVEFGLLMLQDATLTIKYSPDVATNFMTADSQIRYQISESETCDRTARGSMELTYIPADSVLDFRKMGFNYFAKQFTTYYVCATWDEAKTTRAANSLRFVIPIQVGV